MSFADFMNATKKEADVVEYAAASNLIGKDGKPLVWKLKALTTAETERIRKAATKRTTDPKTGLVREDVDRDRLEAGFIVKSIVEPDLTNKELQDHYHCMDPVALLQTLVDRPGDYTALMQKINELSGYAQPDINELVDEAKN